MTHLRDFIGARLDEDEAAALRYIEGVNTGVEEGRWLNWLTAGETLGDYAGHVISYQVLPRAIDHIARHDPARVLREVESKRGILEIHNARDSWGHCMGCGVDSDGSLYMAIDDCTTLRAVAAAYSDHPDYRKEWAT